MAGPRDSFNKMEEQKFDLKQKLKSMSNMNYPSPHP